MVPVQTPFLFFLACFLLLSTVLSRSSLVHAIRHQKQSSETSLFSLSLHPHDAIVSPKHQKNYTAWKLSGLVADAARVKYINSRLRNALFNSDPNFQPEEIESPVSILKGAYVARIGVGQPMKEYNLIADTGSELIWLKCLPCMDCSDPVFDPTQSSSYQALSCTSQQCNAVSKWSTCDASESNCNYQVSYGDKSFSRGVFATEKLTFGSSNSIDHVGIGCGHEVGGSLNEFAGILGLGPDQISLPSQLKATSFSYCLVDADSKSSSTLEFNSAPPGDSVMVPMLRNPMKDFYYYVELTGITVGEDQIPIPPSVYQISSDGTGGIIVDSGTTLTYLDSQVYSSVRDAFRKNAQNLAPSQGNYQGFETCYEVPSDGSIQGPAMSFQFSDGKSLELEPKNYFMRVDDSAYCLVFQPTNQIVSIIGYVQQQGMRVTYDLGNKMIGFSPNKC